MCSNECFAFYSVGNNAGIIVQLHICHKLRKCDDANGDKAGEGQFAPKFDQHTDLHRRRQNGVDIQKDLRFFS